MQLNEYCVYDPSGTPVGVYDFVNQSWKWHINAGTKVAEVTPATEQQRAPGTPDCVLNDAGFNADGSPKYQALPTGTNPPATYFVHDYLGSTRLSYKASVNNGVVSYDIQSAHDYAPFGKTFREYLKGAQDKYQFTGQERDAESGLDNFIARMYDSDLGRFLNTDPHAGKYPACSPYGYSMNNPIRFMDVDGKDVTAANEADRKAILDMIHKTSAGTFDFDKNGKLFLVNCDNVNKNGSEYYRDRLVTAINDSKATIISISQKL